MQEMSSVNQGEYLMIGGVRDGTTIHLKSPTPYVQVPVLNESVFDPTPLDEPPRYAAQQYRRETLRAGDRTYYVYVHNDIPGSDVIGRLIAGYGRDRKEPSI